MEVDEHQRVSAGLGDGDAATEVLHNLLRSGARLHRRRAAEAHAQGGHADIAPAAVLDQLLTKIQHKAGQNALQTTFRRFDGDGNGSVDIGEMLEVLHSFGIHVSANQVEKLMIAFSSLEKTHAVSTTLILS